MKHRPIETMLLSAAVAVTSIVVVAGWTDGDAERPFRVRIGRDGSWLVRRSFTHGRTVYDVATGVRLHRDPTPADREGGDIHAALPGDRLVCRDLPRGGVQVLEVRSGLATPVPHAGDPYLTAVRPDGLAFALLTHALDRGSGRGAGWQVETFDARTLDRLATLPLPDVAIGASDLAWSADGGELLCALNDLRADGRAVQRLLRLDAATGQELCRPDVPTFATGLLALPGGRLLLWNDAANLLSRDGTVAWSVPIAGERPVASPDDGLVAAVAHIDPTDFDRRRVVVLDAADGRTVVDWTTPQGQVGDVRFVDGTLLVALEDIRGEAYRIDPGTGASGRAATGLTPYGSGPEYRWPFVLAAAVALWAVGWVALWLFGRRERGGRSFGAAVLLLVVGQAVYWLGPMIFLRTPAMWPDGVWTTPPG